MKKRKMTIQMQKNWQNCQPWVYQPRAVERRLEVLSAYDGCWELGSWEGRRNHGVLMEMQGLDWMILMEMTLEC
jgi:hypothetical protein